MILSTITLPYTQELFSLFKAEGGSFSHTRASYGARHDGESIIIKIKAEDATALKTVVSSICRVASVFEKAQRVK